MSPARPPALPVAVFLAPTSHGAERAAEGWINAWCASHAGATVVDAPPAAEWPFRYPLVPPLPAGPVVVVARDLHEAWTNAQTNATQLVTTQPVYQLCEWAAALGEGGDRVLVATAHTTEADRLAPDMRARRSTFARVHVTVADDASRDAPVAARGISHPLIRAFRASEPADRLRLVIEALDAGRTPATLLAAASVCMEVHDLDAALRDLDAALDAAPAWAAAHFEHGKLWLRRDDMERARRAFEQAAALLPGFGPAWSNLGATLGELDRPEAALAAFDRALAIDPENPQALNNVGVVCRELGRLTDSEAAFKQVVARAPDLAFGYYNLGHTLFLQGRYHGALTAYTEGQLRDPGRNPVQATRLALCRLAAGDAAGALAELERAAAALPPEYRQQVLADTSATTYALLTHKPDLPGWKQVNDWLSGELSRLARGRA